MKDMILGNHEVYDNMSALREHMQEMGLPYIPELYDLVHMEPREMILLTTYLFNFLPNFLPKETVIFECKVDDKIMKKITLQNPTSFTLTYHVTLDGSPDYSLDDNQVRIAPKSSAEFIVHFHAKVSRAVGARLVFKPKTEGDQIVSPAIFELKSKITGRYSFERHFIKDIRLYEAKNREIKIVNPFDRDVEFTYDLEYLPSSSDFDGAKKKKFGGSVAVTKSKTPEDEGTIIPTFFTTSDRISIRKGKAAKIRLNYVPITFEVHR